MFVQKKLYCNTQIVCYNFKKDLRMAREEKIKNLRILELDRLFGSGQCLNASQLAKKLEVSRSTVMRDIDFLRDRYGAPLEFDKSRNGYYYTDTTFFVKSLMLSEGDLFAVSAVLPLLQQYRNTPIAASMEQILKKIAEMLPDKVSVDALFLNNEISFISDPLPIIEETVFYAVFEGINSQKTLQFEYKSLSRDTYTLREVDPYHVVCQKGNWYMLAFCHTHKNVRVFSLARIRHITTTDKKFSVPVDFCAESYFDTDFGVWNNGTEPLKIELEFAPTIKTYIIERKWHKTQCIKRQNDGTVYLSFMTNQIQEVLHWVMSFGSAVKVLGPEVLINTVAQEIEKMSIFYKKSI